MKNSRTLIVTLSLAAMLTGCSAEMTEKFTSFFDRSNKKPDPSEIKDAPPPQISAETHYASGLMLERQGNLNGAAEQFAKAASQKPDMVDAHNRLGIVKTRLGEFAAGEAAFRKAVQLEPDAPALRNNLGFCLMSAGDAMSAEGAFRKSLELAPDFERARMNLGIALARQRRLGDAAVEFSRVVPPEAAYYNVGVVCMEMNDHAQAERAFREALAVKPGYQPAEDRLASLKTTTPAIATETPQRVTPTPAAVQVTPAPSKPATPAQPAVTVRANQPIGEMRLVSDGDGDAPSP